MLCKQCLEELPESEFYVNSMCSSGRRSFCKRCLLIRRNHAIGKRVVPIEKKCKKCCSIKLSSEFTRRIQNKDGLEFTCRTCRHTDLTERLAAKYNASKELAERMRAATKCEICSKTFSRDSKSNFKCYDHDHKTGKLRGALCGSCNFMLGLAKDDCGLLTKAITYLRDRTEPPVLL